MPEDAGACRCSKYEARIEALEGALKLTQFGFNLHRCPVCAGWNVGPNGETDNAHTKDCPVALALASSAPSPLSAENERLRRALEDMAEGDCEYGDGCPTFGSRHGRCVPCKAHLALFPSVTT